MLSITSLRNKLYKDRVSVRILTHLSNNLTETWLKEHDFNSKIELDGREAAPSEWIRTQNWKSIWLKCVDVCAVVKFGRYSVKCDNGSTEYLLRGIQHYCGWTALTAHCSFSIMLRVQHGVGKCYICAMVPLKEHINLMPEPLSAHLTLVVFLWSLFINLPYSEARLDLYVMVWAEHSIQWKWKTVFIAQTGSGF